MREVRGKLAALRLSHIRHTVHTQRSQHSFDALSSPGLTCHTTATRAERAM